MLNLLRDRFFETKFLTWDGETEGLSYFYSKPWQLSWLVSQGNKILETHNYYLKWKDLNVSPEAARVTGFDAKIIEKQGKDPLEVIQLFDSYLYNPDYLIVGQNILNYDSMIHNSSRLRLGLKSDFSWMRRLYDTHLISKMYKEGIKFNIGEDWLTFQFKLNNYIKKGLKTGLETMIKEFGIEYDASKLHRADFDIRMTLEVFQQLIYKVEI